MNGQVVIAVLSEAVRHFGKITPENELQVTCWVRDRVREIEAGAKPPRPYEPGGFDAKARAAGE